jgi:EAL domain-containing protein (putative c-di-GMP-specific phosphodiesterase class I)/CheY-like chemotaxis protein
LLVVADEAIREDWVAAFAALGHDVLGVGDRGEALQAMQSRSFDAIVGDIDGEEGPRLLRAMQAQDLDLPFVALSGTGEGAAEDALQSGALDVVQKPVDRAYLVAAAERAVRIGRLARVKRLTMASLPGGQVVGAGDRAALNTSLDRAILTMWTVFQPILRRDARLFGYEALMRNRNSDMQRPEEVLGAAQTLDRVLEVGRRMRHFATKPVIADVASGSLCLNVHPRDLLDPEFVSADSPLVGIARRVVLEVSERDPIVEVAQTRRRCRELREMGFRLAIDNLGSHSVGQASFTVLEPDLVKLDRSFVRGVGTDPARQRHLRALIRQCRELGMVVAAEGVETLAELSCVLDLGCDLVLGFLFAQPGPAFPQFYWPPEVAPRAR